MSLALSVFCASLSNLDQPRSFTDNPIGPVADERKFERLTLEGLNHCHQPANKPGNTYKSHEATKQEYQGACKP